MKMVMIMSEWMLFSAVLSSRSLEYSAACSSRRVHMYSSACACVCRRRLHRHQERLEPGRRGLRRPDTGG